MEEEKTSTVETATTEAENVETKAEETKTEEKTFTQKDFNEALKKEVARKTKGIPSEDELKAFKEWKESQKSEEEKRAEKEKSYQDAISNKDKEISDLSKENLLLRKGVKDDDMDYVLFKVSKLEGEFKDNLETFLKDNPKFLVTNEVKETKTVDLGSEHNGEKVSDDTLARQVMGLTKEKER